VIFIYYYDINKKCYFGINQYLVLNRALVKAMGLDSAPRACEDQDPHCQQSTPGPPAGARATREASRLQGMATWGWLVAGAVSVPHAAARTRGSPARVDAWRGLSRIGLEPLSKPPLRLVLSKFNN
jgi:hypothetical protein